MAEDDPSSHRAFEISYSFIRHIAKAKGYDMKGVLSPALHEQDPSRLTSGPSSSPGSRQQRGDELRPGCAVSESDWGQQQQEVQSPFVLDAALFSADM
ncbi:uncharacterized protein BDV17DRAFT_287275 [Aspergillus undulatus]|uniref:uncharacterized protein n=1 Tax=Aspergillus undulatus TaxID=1810928 RepID=UPI003CCCD078